MFKNTEFKEDATYINGRKVSKKWKFISDGTWYDKGEVVLLEDDCVQAGGLFRGIRTCQNPKSEGDWRKQGEKYEDGELCHWCEFTIYDEDGKLIQEAYNGFDLGPGASSFPL